MKLDGQNLKREASHSTSGKARVVIIQYAGEYREAYNRMVSGEEEHYHSARYSVESIAALFKDDRDIAYLCMMSSQRHDELLPNNIRSIAMGERNSVDIASILNMLAALRPTHIILRTPQPEVLKWITNNNIRCIVTIADSFTARSVRDHFRNFNLARLLNNNNIDWVANHNIPACLSLARIGVKREKIVPWDWPHFTPSDGSANIWYDTSRPIRIFYVGSISESKGVGDLLRAMKILLKDDINFELAIAGHDTDAGMQTLAKRIGVARTVTFLGSIPRHDAQRRMEDADIVVIPSRHDYPEGLPLTIYEALAARTPIVASDHPMFAEVLRNGENAAIFRASSPKAMADALRRLISDPPLRALFSERSLPTWHRIQIPVKWGQLIARWVDDTPDDQRWIACHSLDSGLYDARLHHLS